MKKQRRPATAPVVVEHSQITMITVTAPAGSLDIADAIETAQEWLSSEMGEWEIDESIRNTESTVTVCFKRV